MAMTHWGGPRPAAVARHMPAEARSTKVGVQGMPDGGEDAFHMRAASHPEISTGRATSSWERRPRRLPAGSAAGTGAGSHCHGVMTGSTAAKLGDSQGTQGSHTSPSAQAGVRQP